MREFPSTEEHLDFLDSSKADNVELKSDFPDRMKPYSWFWLDKNPDDLGAGEDDPSGLYFHITDGKFIKVKGANDGVS